MTKISFMGDINPGGVLTYTGGISLEVKQLLSESSLRVGTLECALGDGTTPCQIKMADPKNGTIIYAPDECINLLKEMHIDVVSLANNHSFDLGDEGFHHMVKLLEECGIKYVGAGRNIQEASKPLIINIERKSFCFLAYLETRIPCIRIASQTKAGANPFNIEKAVSDIEKYKQQYDYVIVMPHWGKENKQSPRPDIIRWSAKLASAGADAIIASHTHVFQPVIERNKTIIAYSLGNFLFPDRYIDSPRVTVYPDYERRNRQDIPIVQGFPLVNTLSLKVINNISRIGGILTIDFLRKESKLHYEVKNTYLTSDNFLVLRNMSIEFAREYSRLQKYSKNVICLKLYLHIKLLLKNIIALLKK